MKKLLTLVTGILTGLTVAVLSILNIGAWDNGLAKTPPMGWNSWNIFHGDINETKIKQIADAMVSSGMKDAGYVYLNLDDNWMANPARDANGNLRADPTRFPSGIKALADYVHAKGLKLGIYGDRGTMTCMNVPQSGSKGYEDKDAKTFASWGIDYLKYDNCNIPNGSDMKTDYQKMQNALANCGRPIVFSICAWEYQSWMPETGNLWRTTRDITDKWDTGTSFFRGIINLIDENAKYTSSAKPGAWNDPDMLEVGNGGCTTEEYRTQMSMWSMMASPLIAGNDIRTMSQTTKDLLMNKEVISVDQDPAGIQGSRVKSSNGLEIWVKPLGTDGKTKAVALLNRNSTTSNITVNWSDIGFSGSISVRDLWAKADKGSFTGSYTASVPSHGTVMLKVTSAPPAPIDPFKKIEAENYNDQFGVEIEDNPNDNGKNIGYIQNGDYTVYRNVDFGDGATSFKASAGSNSTGGNIEIRLDSLTGTLVGTCVVPSTGGWKTWTDVSCNISKVSGKHDVYLKFTGESDYLMNLDWFIFDTKAISVSKLGDINSDGEIDSLDFMLIKKHLLGLESVENKLLADLDASGEVDSIDFALMKQYLLCIITTFPGQITEPIPSTTILPSIDNVGKDGVFAVTIDKNVGPNGKGVVARPSNLGTLGVKKHPIFIWGPGGGGQPMDDEHILRRLASQGFVVYSEESQWSGEQAKTGLDWIIAQNNNSASPYYNKLDISRIGAGGYSLGSTGAWVVANDPRISTTIHVDGGSLDGTGASKMRKPTALICGLNDTLALGNTQKDYKDATVPIWFGGIIGGGHDSGRVKGVDAITAWLRWHLSGETDRKSMFVGTGATFNTGIWQSQYKNW